MGLIAKDLYKKRATYARLKHLQEVVRGNFKDGICDEENHQGNSDRGTVSLHLYPTF